MVDLHFGMLIEFNGIGPLMRRLLFMRFLLRLYFLLRIRASCTYMTCESRIRKSRLSLSKRTVPTMTMFRL